MLPGCLRHRDVRTPVDPCRNSGRLSTRIYRCSSRKRPDRLRNHPQPTVLMPGGHTASETSAGSWKTGGMSTPDSTLTLSPDDITAITGNLDEVAERARAAAEASGRDGDAVKVMLATKTQPAWHVRVALEHGFALSGEDELRESVGQAAGSPDLAPEARLRAPLWGNMVSHTVRQASCIQSVDNLPLAEKISSRL